MSSIAAYLACFMNEPAFRAMPMPTFDIRCEESARHGGSKRPYQTCSLVTFSTQAVVPRPFKSALQPAHIRTAEILTTYSRDSPTYSRDPLCTLFEPPILLFLMTFSGRGLSPGRNDKAKTSSIRRKWTKAVVAGTSLGASVETCA